VGGIPSETENPRGGRGLPRNLIIGSLLAGGFRKADGHKTKPPAARIRVDPILTILGTLQEMRRQRVLLITS